VTINLSTLTKRRYAFTLVELLVVIAVISLLAAMLFPVFFRAREKARQITCVSNLRQIGIAVALYNEDNDDLYPLGGDPVDIYGDDFARTQYALVAATMPLVPQTLQLYVKDNQVWDCPDDTGYTEGGSFEDFPLSTAPAPSAYAKFGMSYAYDTYLPLMGLNDATLTAYGGDPPYTQYGPDHIILFQDMDGSWHGGQAWQDKRYNVLFCDGHVHYTTRAQDSDLWHQKFTLPTNQ
jgi:prepilin-type N-terminal cleavage/methylation domain-containing protein/prepilin-type processing-associated H-X9-DG protein